MRVPERVPELGGHPFDERLGNGVFQQFGLVVDLIPAVPELLDQERLNQPVPPDHGQGQPDAVGRQGDGAVGLVVTRPWSLSLRTISETEELATPSRWASCGGRDGLVLPLRKGVDDLDVVLDRGGGQRWSSQHPSLPSGGAGDASALTARHVWVR